MERVISDAKAEQSAQQAIQEDAMPEVEEVAEEDEEGYDESEDIPAEERQGIADKIRQATGGALPRMGTGDTGTSTRNFTSVKDAFDFIAEQLKSDPIAQKALELFRGSVEGNEGVKMDNDYDWSGDPALAYFQPDGRVQINYDRIGDNSDLLARTILHEFIHAATKNEINNNRSFNEKLDFVLRDIREALGITTDNSALITRLVADNIIDENKYGTANEHELIAELFTNEKFFEYLKGIQYKGDSLLKRIYMALVRAFKAITGMKAGDVASMADYLIGLTQSKFDGMKIGNTDYSGAPLASIKAQLGTNVMTGALTAVATSIEATGSIKEAIADGVEYVKQQYATTGDAQPFTDAQIRNSIREALLNLGVLAPKTKHSDVKKNIAAQTKPSPKSREITFRELWRRKAKNQQEGAGIVKSLMKEAIAFFRETKVDLKGSAVVRVLNQMAKLANVSNTDARLDAVMDAIDKIVQDQASISYANDVRNKIRKAIKSKSRNGNAETTTIIKDFSRIIPNQVENINDYIELADRILGVATGVRVTVKEGVPSGSNTNFEVTNSEITSFIEAHEKYVTDIKKERLAQAYNDVVGSTTCTASITPASTNSSTACSSA